MRGSGRKPVRRAGMDIDVIIPVYKPGRELFTLLDRLMAQTVPVKRILLINTEEKYFEQLTMGTNFQQKYKNVSVFHISKREFDHGRTRRMAVKKSQSPVFIMMTQDALPVDKYLIEKLIQRLEGNVAVAYARQISGRDSSILEQFSRQFNYPPKSRLKSAADLDELGIKTYFCSDVCAAYRRDIYEELGGFVRHAIFNEDMLYAAAAIEKGYSIAYEAGAQVLHSHNYSCGQQFHRNFDLGVSQAEHPEVFAQIRSESEGMRMVKEATSYLKEKRLWGKLLYFYLQCFCKYAGFILGKNYRKLPRRLVLRCTASPDYWKRQV